MNKLISSNELVGYTVHAKDGDIGTLRELYFDDATWRIKHLVIDTGRWLPGRRVLLPPACIDRLHWEQRRLAVALTREQVRHSPAVGTDKPVAEQLKAERKPPHNWALSLAGEALAGVPEALETPAFQPINDNGRPFDPHLRTTRVVTGLTLRASDGAIGRIADIIVEDGSWEVRYLVVERDGGERSAVPARVVKTIDVDDKVAVTDLPQRGVTTGFRHYRSEAAARMS